MGGRGVVRMSLSLFPLVSHSYHYPFHSRNYESEFATLTSNPSTPNGDHLILATLDKPYARHARLFNTIIIVSAVADPILYVPTLRSEHPALGTNTYKMCFAPH